MSDSNTLASFVDALARQKRLSHVYNPYAYRHELSGEICRHNLSRYLNLMLGRHPQTILVGEALGHRGGRLTGIPFSSERLIINNSFAQLVDFSTCRLAHRERPIAESTATIMWNGLYQLGVPVLLWNAFPFHPHKPKDPKSNRPPSATELKIGFAYLSQLLMLFDLKQTVAVGRKADYLLTRQGIDHVTVRHPSYGGKAEFLEGLFKYIPNG